MKYLIFFLPFLFLSLSCKKSTEDTFDELRKNASVFRSAIFCHENPSLLATRKDACDAVLQESIESIEAILNRQLDLVMSKVIVPKQVGEEIELFLRIKTDLGIRYLEIWKQSVILE